MYFTQVNKFGKIFLIYKEIWKGAGAESYIYEEGFPNIGGNARIFSRI